MKVRKARLRRMAARLGYRLHIQASGFELRDGDGRGIGCDIIGGRPGDRDLDLIERWLGHLGAGRSHDDALALARVA